MSGMTNVPARSAKTDGMSANGIQSVQSAAPDQLASTRISAAMLSATRIAESRTDSSASCEWRAGHHLDRPTLAKKELDLELADAGVDFAGQMALGCGAVIAGHAYVPALPDCALDPPATVLRVSDCLTRPSQIALTFGPWNVAALNRGIQIA